MGGRRATEGSPAQPGRGFWGTVGVRGEVGEAEQDSFDQ